MSKGTHASCLASKHTWANRTRCLTKGSPPAQPRHTHLSSGWVRGAAQRPGSHDTLSSRSAARMMSAASISAITRWPASLGCDL